MYEYNIALLFIYHFVKLSYIFKTMVLIRIVLKFHSKCSLVHLSSWLLWVCLASPNSLEHSHLKLFAKQLCTLFAAQMPNVTRLRVPRSKLL